MSKQKELRSVENKVLATLYDLTSSASVHYIIAISNMDRFVKEYAESSGKEFDDHFLTHTVAMALHRMRRKGYVSGGGSAYSITDKGKSVALAYLTGQTPLDLALLDMDLEVSKTENQDLKLAWKKLQKEIVNA